MSGDQDGCEWVNFWYRPTQVVSVKGPLNGCVYVCVYILTYGGLQRACYEEQCRYVGKDLAHSANYDALKECTLLERCLKETLRLRPPLVTIMRNCRTPQVAALHHFSPGWVLVTASRLEKVWVFQKKS